MTEWLIKSDINVLEWPLQSPDLNPIENVWRELKSALIARYLKNINVLETICEDEWSRIPSDVCLNLVKDHNKRLADVINLMRTTVLSEVH